MPAMCFLGQTHHRPFRGRSAPWHVPGQPYRSRQAALHLLDRLRQFLLSPGALGLMWQHRRSCFSTVVSPCSRPDSSASIFATPDVRATPNVHVARMEKFLRGSNFAADCLSLDDGLVRVCDVRAISFMRIQIRLNSKHQVFPDDKPDSTEWV